MYMAKLHISIMFDSRQLAKERLQYIYSLCYPYEREMEVTGTYTCIASDS